MFNNKIVRGLIALLLLTPTISSCSKERQDMMFQPLETIYAKTPKADELSLKAYEKYNLAQVNEASVWTYDKSVIQPDDRSVKSNAVMPRGTMQLALANPVRVSDGDTATFSVLTNYGTESLSFRFYGIDTPELHHPSKGVEAWGIAAKQYVEARIQQAKENNEKIVIMSSLGGVEGTYNRLVSYIFIGKRCINLELIEIGLAKVLPEGVKENDPLYDELFAANKERADTTRYPSTDFGDYGFHVTNYTDPNFIYDDSLPTADVEYSKKIKDLNFTYTFDFEHQGLLEEIPMCQDNPAICKMSVLQNA